MDLTMSLQTLVHADALLLFSGGCRWGFSFLVSDSTRFEAFSVMQSLCRPGFPLSVPGKMTFDTLIAVLGCASPDTSSFARSLLYLDLVLLVPDFLHLGAFSPLRSHARLGVFAPVFDSSHVESLLPIHCLSCSDPTPSILKRGRPGFSVFVPDFLHLDILLSLHSLAQPGTSLPALDLASFGSSSSLRSTL